MSTFEESIINAVSGCALLIYAPPAYGKTTFQNQSAYRHEIGFLDTDSFQDYMPPGEFYSEAIITNIPDLACNLDYSLCLFFLPSREKFERDCRYRGLPYQDSWYDHALACAHLAGSESNVIIITSELPILYYDRFIHKCFNCAMEGEAFPVLPPPPKDGVFKIRKVPIYDEFGQLPEQNIQHRPYYGSAYTPETTSAPVLEHEYAVPPHKEVIKRVDVISLVIESNIQMPRNAELEAFEIVEKDMRPALIRTKREAVECPLGCIQLTDLPLSHYHFGGLIYIVSERFSAYISRRFHQVRPPEAVVTLLKGQVHENY